MSANDFDLLNPANAYSRSDNARRTYANSQREEPLPGPQGWNLTERTRRFRDTYGSSDDDNDENREENSAPGASSTLEASFNVTSDAANSGEYDESSEFAGIAEGKRLVIAVDYGTTFTGTWIQESVSETDTDVQ